MLNSEVVQTYKHNWLSNYGKLNRINGDILEVGHFPITFMVK